jgi:hypothetical protein
MAAALGVQGVEAPNLRFLLDGVRPKEEWEATMLALVGEEKEELGREWCAVIDKWIAEGI